MYETYTVVYEYYYTDNSYPIGSPELAAAEERYRKELEEKSKEKIKTTTEN
jgi:hypothetical protein